MNRLSINLLTNVVLMLVGVLLIIFYSRTDVQHWIALVIGGLFALSSMVYLLKVLRRHDDASTSSDYLGVVPGVGGLCFGIVLLMKPDLFDGVISFLMGVLLVVLGVFHIIYLLLSRRTIDVRGWYFIAPLMVVAGGASILFSPELRQQGGTVALLTGLGLLLFNVTSLQEYSAERRSRKDQSDTTADSTDADHQLPPAPKPDEPHYEI